MKCFVSRVWLFFLPCCIHNGPWFKTSKPFRIIYKANKSSNISDKPPITKSINVVRRVCLSDWINGTAGCWIKFISKQEEPHRVKPEEILNPANGCPLMLVLMKTLTEQHVPPYARHLIFTERSPLWDLYSLWVLKRCDVLFEVSSAAVLTLYCSTASETQIN